MVHQIHGELEPDANGSVLISGEHSVEDRPSQKDLFHKTAEDGTMPPHNL